MIETASLLEKRTETPLLEAQVLAAFSLQKTRPWVISHAEFLPDYEEMKRLDIYRHRLLMGEPLAYITGIRSFYGFDFTVNRNVLIPRPETELLVEEAIGWRRNLDKPVIHTCDVGAGSGCITVSLGAHYPGDDYTAIDRSPRAIRVARENAQKIIPNTAVNWICTDLLTGVKRSFDLICANLPYIPSGMLDNLPVSQYEPRLALDGGEDGMRLILRLMDQIKTRLRAGGLALFEIEETQGEKILAEARTRFPQASIEVKKDLAGKMRLLRLEKEEVHGNSHH